MLERLRMLVNCAPPPGLRRGQPRGLTADWRRAVGEHQSEVRNVVCCPLEFVNCGVAVE